MEFSTNAKDPLVIQNETSKQSYMATPRKTDYHLNETPSPEQIIESTMIHPIEKGLFQSTADQARTSPLVSFTTNPILVRH